MSGAGSCASGGSKFDPPAPAGLGCGTAGGGTAAAHAGRIMNTANAIGFLLMGLAMAVLPLLAPGLFPPSAIDATSARMLWVEIMGGVQIVLGSTFLARAGFVAAIDGIRGLAEQRGALATGDWQPDSVPPELVTVDFRRPAMAVVGVPFTMRAAHRVSDGAAALADHAAAGWRALGSAAEARVTNLIGRPTKLQQPVSA